MAAGTLVEARRICSRNPATGEVLRELACSTASEIQSAAQHARSAQAAWAALPVGRRVEAIRKFQRLLHEKKQEIARAITGECGKPYVEALLTEVLVVLDAARFLIQNAHAFLRDEPVPHGNPVMKTKSARLVREPYGVIGIISPWNYPFSVPAIEAMAALVTGNAVVVKPSEYTPLVALELESLLHAAGVPQDVFKVVVGDGATGAALVDSGVDKVVFTGSVRTGQSVAHAAAERLLPVLLELGGKDPMLVLDDADVDVASSAAVWGAFVNTGQTCLSVERCYVHRSLYEPFLAACVEKATKLRVGDGMHPDTEVGPLIHERQLRTVESHVDEALVMGAQLLVGGKRLPAIGPNFYAPTVLADVHHEMRIMRDETFGPVLPVMAFSSDDEAVALANDSEFGLAASVWTRDRGRGERLARRIQAGTVMVNDVVSCFGISEAPHGGVKASGIGRTHGRMGLEEMVRVKYIDTDLLPRRKKVWWYSYGSEFAWQMEGFVDLLFARGLLRRLQGGRRAVRALFGKRLL
ncbi:MAG TPA: aldehyde dehydrogenase family protein [Terriglobales bacterium]|jgi:succinate-semialdehyde dehydrogenase/glutarate-semialdehyde dehydrogenase|nr:aldehyde dehydrogenase family protein [Terriglobales bacterium]